MAVAKEHHCSDRMFAVNLVIVADVDWILVLLVEQVLAVSPFGLKAIATYAFGDHHGIGKAVTELNGSH